MALYGYLHYQTVVLNLIVEGFARAWCENVQKRKASYMAGRLGSIYNPVFRCTVYTLSLDEANILFLGIILKLFAA